MGKFGDALRNAAKHAKQARETVRESVKDAIDGAEKIVDAVVDDSGDESSDNGDDGDASTPHEMAITAMDGMAALITVIDDVGEAVVEVESKYEKKGRAAPPDKVYAAIVTALDDDGKDDGLDSVRGFFRGMIYAAVTLRGE